MAKHWNPTPTKAVIRLCVLALGVAVFSPDTTSAEPEGEVISGRRIAEASCTECHAIHSYEQTSPNPDAPHFRTIADAPAATANDLLTRLQSSHPAMPNVMLTPEEAVDVVAYLLSLRDW